MADGSLIFDTKLDSTGLQKGLAGVGNIARSSVRAMSTAMVAAGAAVGAGVAASIKFGQEYETSMAKVQTMFGDVNVDMDNLNQKMLAISSSTGLAATDLGQAMYSALSAGIPVTEDMAASTDFLSGVVKLAKAGFTDVDTALTATAKTLNAYNLDVSESERIQGILMQTQNKGITTVGELGAALANVTPIAAAMGVEFEFVGAALATMTAKGTPTAQATTQLRQMVAELGKAGTQAAKGLEKAVASTEYAGMSFTDMMEAGVPLNEVLNLMSEYAEKNDIKIVDMFSSIEAGQAALALTGESAETFTRNIEAMYNTAGLVDSGYETMMNTLEGQTDRLKESAKNLGISIYNGMSGKLKDMAGLANDYIARLQHGFDEGGTQGLVTALGDVLADMVTQVAAGLPSVVSIVTGLLDALVTSLSDDANKTKIATGLAGAIEAAFTFAEAVPNLVDAGLDIMTELVTQIAANADTTAPKIIKAISDTLMVMVEHAPELIAAGLKIAVALIKAIADDAPTTVPLIVAAIMDALVAISAAAPELLAAGATLAVALVNAIIASLPALLNGVVDIFMNLFTDKLAIDKLFQEQFGATQAAYEQFKRSVADADTKFDTTVADAEAKRALAKELLDDYDTILGKYNGEDLTEADKTKLEEIVERLLALYPELDAVIGPNTDLYNLNTAAIRSNIDAMADQAVMEGYAEYLTAMAKAAADAAIEYKKAELQLQANVDAVKEIDQQISTLKALPPATSFAEVLGVSTGAGKTKLSELQDQKAQLEEVIRQAQELLGKLAEAQTAAQQELATTKAAFEDLTTKYEDLTPAAGAAADSVKEVGTAAEESTDQINAQTEATDNLNTKLDETAAKAGEASVETTEAIDATVTEAERIAQTVADLQEANTLIEQVNANITTLNQTLSMDAATALATITTLSETVTEQHGAMLEAIKTVFAEQQGALAQSGTDAAQAIFNAMSAVINIETGNTLATEFLMAVRDAAVSNTPTVKQAFADMASQSHSLLMSWTNAFYNAGASWSSNLASGIRSGQGEVASAVQSLISSAITAARNVSSSYKASSIPGHKAGLTTVPYDNYLAMLHKGERVLTAAEAKVYNQAYLQSSQASGFNVGDVITSKDNNTGVIHVTLQVGEDVIAEIFEPIISEAQADRQATVKG